MRLLPVPSPLRILSTLALAAVAVAAPAEDDIRFVDVTSASGIDFVHNTGAFGQKWLPETMGSGVVVFDYNGDGRQDLLFINGTRFAGNDGHAGAFAPNFKLVNGSSAEGIGCSEHHFQSLFFELKSQFTDGCSFANPVHAHDHDHVGAVDFGQGEIAYIFGVVFSEELGNFFFEDGIEFIGTEVLIA